MKIKNLLVMLAAVVVFAALAAPVLADQPLMQLAKTNLEKAQDSLRDATPDKGGHRQIAMDLIARAIAAVNNGIEYDRTHFTPRRRHDSDLDLNSLMPKVNPVDQPNMMKARAHLQNAITNLNRASEDKGGYRKQALDLARSALAEVNAGIEYDRRH